MKKLMAILCVLVFLFSLTACENISETEQSSNSISSQDSAVTVNVALEAETESKEQKPESDLEPPITEEENTVLSIEIIVGDKTFTATLYDNETVRALLEQLPMTINMNELNGNEKYYYLSDSLPTDSSIPSGIHAGDLMLYGNDCLVLFYESFSTSYSYTPLGYIDDPAGLAAALGAGSVEITFR